MSTSHPAELQLLDYVEGSLAGEELRGLRRHVTTCSACQETLRELSHAVDVLERLPTVDIPHDGMRRAARPRNRRKLWMRALPIFAIVLAAGASRAGAAADPTGVERRTLRRPPRPPRRGPRSRRPGSSTHVPRHDSRTATAIDGRARRASRRSSRPTTARWSRSSTSTTLAAAAAACSRRRARTTSPCS